MSTCTYACKKIGCFSTSLPTYQNLLPGPPTSGLASCRRAEKYSRGHRLTIHLHSFQCCLLHFARPRGKNFSIFFFQKRGYISFFPSLYMPSHCVGQPSTYEVLNMKNYNFENRCTFSMRVILIERKKFTF